MNRLYPKKSSRRSVVDIIPKNKFFIEHHPSFFYLPLQKIFSVAHDLLVGLVIFVLAAGNLFSLLTPGTVLATDYSFTQSSWVASSTAVNQASNLITGDNPVTSPWNQFFTSSANLNQNSQNNYSVLSLAPLTGKQITISTDSSIASYSGTDVSGFGFNYGLPTFSSSKISGSGSNATLQPVLAQSYGTGVPPTNVLPNPAVGMAMLPWDASGSYALQLEYQSTSATTPRSHFATMKLNTDGSWSGPYASYDGANTASDNGDISSDNLYGVTGGGSSILVEKFNKSTIPPSWSFISLGAIPDLLRTSNASARWTSDRQFLVAAYSNSPYLEAFPFDGSSFTSPISGSVLYPTITSQITGIAVGPKTTQNEDYIAFSKSSSVGPFLYLYKIVRGTTPQMVPVTPPGHSAGDVATQPLKPISSIAWSPDGKSLVVGLSVATYGTNNLYVYSLQGGYLVQTGSASTAGWPPGVPSSLSFSADSKLLVVGSSNYTSGQSNFMVYNFDSTNGTIPSIFLSSFNPQPASIGQVSAFSPDGNYLTLSGSANSSLFVYPRNSNAGTGVYTSGVLDILNAKTYTTLTSSAIVPSNASITLEVRGGNTSTNPDSWLNQWHNVSSSGSSIAFLNANGGSRYLQYRVTLTLSQAQVQIPYLNSLTFNYTQYAADEYLISSSFKEGNGIVSKLQWMEDATALPAGTGIEVSLSTALDNSGQPGVWSPWTVFNDSSGTKTQTTTTVNGQSIGVTLVTINQSSIPSTIRDPLNYWFRYKVRLTSPGGANTPNVYQVAVQYSFNSQPGVTLIAPQPTQTSNGTVSAQYNVSDSDSGGSYSMSLFYDVGATLTNNVALSDVSIPISVSNGQSLSNLIPSEGTLLVDNEEITYTLRGGSYVGNQFSPVTRGAYGTSKADHLLTDAQGNPRTVKVWIRASDPRQVTDFPLGHPTASVTGTLATGKGITQTITWTPSTDIKNFYQTATQVLVLAQDDGQIINQVGTGISSAFTLDTQAPDLGANPLNVSDAAVVDVPNNGWKTPNTTVNLSVSPLTATSDNPAAGDWMAFCPTVGTNATSCTSSNAQAFLSGSTPSGWTTKQSLGTSYTFAISNTQTAGSGKGMYMVAWDGVGNMTNVYSAGGASPVKPVVYDNVRPPQPRNLKVENISSSLGRSALYISWTQLDAATDWTGKTDAYSQQDFKQFAIYRATGNTPTVADFSLLTVLTNSLATGYVDDNVSDTSKYSYRIQVIDNVGNASVDLSNTTALAAGSPLTPAIVGTPAPTPPTNIKIRYGNVPSNCAPGSCTITLQWDTDIASDSHVAYSSTQTADFSNAASQGNSTITTTNHTVNLVGLNPSTQYYFEVRSATSDNNNTATIGPRKVFDASDFNFTPPTGFALFTSAAGNALVFSTPSPPPVAATPQISNVNYSNLSFNSVTINWTTDIDSNSFVEYGTNSSPPLGAYFGQQESIKNHSVTLSGLQSGTTYNYRVHSTAAGQEGVSAVAQFPTPTNPNDTTPPTIVPPITVTGIQSTTATINWSTDERANALVKFWTGTDPQQLWPSSTGPYVLSHTIQLPLNLKPDTDYSFTVISADPSNNSVESPEQTFHTLLDTSTLSAPTISSISNDPPTATDVTVHWLTTGVPSDSVVEYSEDSPVYDRSQLNPVFTENHQVTLYNLTPGKLHYFRVKSSNTQGLSSTQDTCGAQPCTFTTLLSNNPLPQIITAGTQKIVVTPDINSATIEWHTTTPGNSLVEYGFDLSYGNTYGQVNDNTTDHIVALPNNLKDNQTYHFRLHTMDDFKQQVVYPVTPDPTDAACGSDHSNCLDPTFTTTPSLLTTLLESKAAPIITNVAPLLVTDTRAVIGWLTDKLADSQVDYGVNASYGNTSDPNVYQYKLANTTNPLALTRSHSVTIDPLQPNSQYYFKVSSVDMADQKATDDNGGAGYTFTTNAGTKIGDYTAPQGVQGELKERTDPPIISDVQVSSITDSGAIVTWATDADSTSLVSYGDTIDYGDMAGDYSSLVSNHSVELKNLDGGTEYHFSVVSVDNSGNRAQSDDDTFTTLGVKGTKPKAATSTKDTLTDKDKNAADAIAALNSKSKLSLDKIVGLLKDFSEEDISAILSQLGIQLTSAPSFTGGQPKVDVTQTTATISWETNKPSDSRVAFVVGDEYQASKDNPYTSELGDTESFVADHEVTLTGLKPGTIYHFQLRSREAAGRTGKSKDYTLKTLPERPEITKIKVVDHTEHSVTLSWKTNAPTKTLIEYTNTATGKKQSQGDAQLATGHEFTLINLDSDSAYLGKIRAENEAGTAILSPEFHFATIKDITPPEIAQLRTDLSLVPGKKDVVQSVISWRTSEPSTSKIIYEEGLSKSTDFKETTAEQTDLVTFHVVVLTKLNPATIYRFKAISNDASGNTGLSKEFKILTPKKEESVLELIIKNFEETFGFLQGK